MTRDPVANGGSITTAQGEEEGYQKEVLAQQSQSTHQADHILVGQLEVFGM